MTIRSFVLLLLAALPLAAGPIDGFSQTNLVSNLPNAAPKTDPSLQNPWGLAFAPTSPFWVSNNVTNLATIYNGFGAKQGLVVNVPGHPTGAVFNASAGFNGDLFIFAELDGTIEGWRNALGTNTENLFSSANSAYTGLATAAVGSGNYLYAANFAQARIDVFGSTGAPALPGNFTDPNIPAGFAPFGVETIGSQVYVTYAKVDPATHEDQAGPGNGFVDVFSTDGTFLQRMVSQGVLNSPWGLALAPAGFGSVGGDLLVGNLGDGRINAFDPTGNLVGTLATLSGDPLENDGLWAIKFGNGGTGFRPNSLYLTAGLNDEVDGLFARIDPVPEPATFAMFGLGAILVAWLRRRRVAGGA